MLITVLYDSGYGHTAKQPQEKNRVGGWLGAMAQSDDASPDITPIQSDIETAAHLGERVAEVTGQFKSGAAR